MLFSSLFPDCSVYEFLVWQSVFLIVSEHLYAQKDILKYVY